MFKYTLVPEDLFSDNSAREVLSSVEKIGEKPVKHIELPHYKAVLVYTGEEDRVSVLLSITEKLHQIAHYNKLIAHIEDEYIDIAVATGEKLLMLKTFKASDPVTAQYFIFASTKEFQLNPELTTIYFHGEVSESVKDDLFRYFASVENI